MKHNIEKKFTLDMSFKFKKNIQKSKIVQINEDEMGQKKLYMISIII